MYVKAKNNEDNYLSTCPNRLKEKKIIMPGK